MRFRRLNHIVHRDLGYMVTGTVILYALSGIALNHAKDWDPNFVIQRQEVQVQIPEAPDAVSQQWVLQVVESLGQQGHYRGHDCPTSAKMKIYLDDGSVVLDLRSGSGIFELITRRPIFYRINCLHIGPRRAWIVFSDVFAVALVIVALTGMLMLKGPIKRALVLTAIGLIVPLLFMFVGIPAK